MNEEKRKSLCECLKEAMVHEIGIGGSLPYTYDQAKQRILKTLVEGNIPAAQGGQVKALCEGLWLIERCKEFGA